MVYLPSRADGSHAGDRLPGIEVVGEVLDRAAHRHRGQPAHGAQRALGHHVAEVFEQRQVLVAVLARDDPVDHLDAAHRADPARRALAARLRGAELHREPGLRRHVDGVVEHHDAAVADHRAGRDERLVVHRQVELGRRQVRAERAADLDRTHRTAGTGAAAVAVPRVRPASPRTAVSTMPPCRMLPPSWNTWVPRERSDAELADTPARRRRGSSARWHSVSTLLTTVGLPNRPVDGRDRRLRPDHAALALEAFQHRGLLAADVGAAADPDVQVEGQRRAEDVVAEPALGARAISMARRIAATASGYSDRM